MKRSENRRMVAGNRKYRFAGPGFTGLPDTARVGRRSDRRRRAATRTISGAGNGGWPVCEHTGEGQAAIRGAAVPSARLSGKSERPARGSAGDSGAAASSPLSVWRTAKEKTRKKTDQLDVCGTRFVFVYGRRTGRVRKAGIGTFPFKAK